MPHRLGRWANIHKKKILGPPNFRSFAVAQIAPPQDRHRRETIKPFSPTPEGHSTYKLSLLDQLAPKSYIPLILFYSANNRLSLLDDNSLNHLKQSLSKTLTHMYPLAGRIKDSFSIECKDQGVEFVQVRVADNMSAILDHPRADQLQQLLPCDTRANKWSPGSDPELGGQVLLLVQINHFGCGGTAIGMCIHHTIADFSTAGTFLRTWAEVARGQENIVDNFVVDCTPIFPPQDVSSLDKDLRMAQEADQAGTKANRFILSGSNISALKEKATKSGWPCSDPPSRVVAASTFIWASIIEAIREGSRKNWNMSTLINLRPKMDAPISPHCLGNMVQGTVARCETSEGQSINYGALAKIVRDSIRVVNDEYIKNLYADEEYFENYKRGVFEFAKYYDNMGWLNTSSWCRNTVYEADFGWGKPIWAGTSIIPSTDFAIFMDTSDGEGIEAWVYLKEEDMTKLEQNPEFLAYVSVTQSL